jgi:hypothetical protein
LKYNLGLAVDELTPDISEIVEDKVGAITQFIFGIFVYEIKGPDASENVPINSNAPISGVADLVAPLKSIVVAGIVGIAPLSANETPDGTHVFEIVPATKLFSINVPDAFPAIYDLN